MTYFIAESAIAGTNQEKLTVEVWTTPDITAITWNTTTVSIRKKYTASQVTNTGDHQLLTRTGTWSGTTWFRLPSTGSPASVVIADETVSVNTIEGQVVNINVGGNITDHYAGANFSANVSFTIPARPSKISTFTVPSSLTLGTAATINITPPDASFTHEISWFGFDIGLLSIATNVATTYSWTPPIETIAPMMPNTASAGVSILVATYDGSGVYIGSEIKSVTFVVPSSAGPNLANITATETVTNVATYVGAFVQNLSKIKFDLGTSTTQYDASIVKSEIIMENVSHNGTTWTSDLLNQTGDVVVTGKITDSRGFTDEKTVTVNVLAYQSPTVSTFTVDRAQSNGTLDILGTYAKSLSQATVSSLVNVTEKNTLTYTLYRKLRSDVNWTLHKTAATIAGITLNATDTINASLTATSTYDFKIEVTDKFKTTTILLAVPVGAVTMSWNKNGVGIGKIWERGALDVAGDIYQNGVTVVPTGTVLPYAGSTAPTGFSLCDGGTLNRTTEARLFAVIGSTYGAGDGSTTFNKPNLKGKIPVGLDSTQTEFDSLGETGGEKTHKLTIAEMPAHYHSDPTSSNVPGSYELAAIGSNWGYDYGLSAPTDTRGGDAAHNNLQPYVTMNYIIKL